MMNKTMFMNIVKWLLTRVGVLMLVWCLVLPQIVNFKTMGDRLKIRRLNDSRPDFSNLVNFQMKNKPLTTSQWRQYQSYFNLVLEYIPNDPIAQGVLGYIKMQTKNESAAVDLLEKSSKQAPIYFWANYNLGLYYYKQGQYQKAAQYLEQAINLPVEAVGKVMLDSIIYRQIFVSNAFKLSISERVKQAYEDAYLMLIAALDQMDNSQAALGLSLKGVQTFVGPKQALYYYAGLSCLKLKELDKAIALLNKTVELDGKSPWAYFWIAKIYELLGQMDKVEEYRKAYAVLKSNQSNILPYDQVIGYRFF